MILFSTIASAIALLIISLWLLLCWQKSCESVVCGSGCVEQRKRHIMLFIPLNDPIPDFKCVSMKIRKWTNSMFRNLTVRRWWCELLLWWNVWTRFKQPNISMQNDSKSSSLFASHWNQLGQSIFPNKLLSSCSKVNPHIFLLKWNNQLNRRQFHSRVTTRSLWVKAITLPNHFIMFSISSSHAEHLSHIQSRIVTTTLSSTRFSFFIDSFFHFLCLAWFFSRLMKFFWFVH